MEKPALNSLSHLIKEVNQHIIFGKKKEEIRRKRKPIKLKIFLEEIYKETGF